LLSISGTAVPRKPSLAPSPTTTTAGCWASSQRSRRKPPAEVSPETPALSTRTGNPSALSWRSSRAG
jgi:hypothetical protein